MTAFSEDVLFDYSAGPNLAFCLLTKTAQNRYPIADLDNFSMYCYDCFEYQEEFFKNEKEREMKQAWFNQILQQETQAHLNFFGREFDLSDFQKTLAKHGEDKIKEWQELLLEPHFLPEIKMDRKATFPGWKVRPDNHSYEVVHQGKVLRRIGNQIQPDLKADHLLGNTVLIDTRLKPAYESGKQMYKDDTFLGPVLTQLRQAGIISKYEYGQQSSRFGVSADDWEGPIKLALSQDKRFGLKTEQWRLERAIEANVIPQLYMHMPRKDNGQTNTWSWYEEYFGGRSSRVDGGDSDYGGLAGFYWCWSGDHWYYQAFCPLAVL